MSRTMWLMIIVIVGGAFLVGSSIHPEAPSGKMKDIADFSIDHDIVTIVVPGFGEFGQHERLLTLDSSSSAVFVAAIEVYGSLRRLKVTVEGFDGKTEVVLWDHFGDRISDLEVTKSDFQPQT